MRRIAMLAALALPLLVVATTPAAAQRQVRRNWSTVVTRNAAGYYVIGNPAAKVKLVEYLSYTCTHCADFANTGMTPLKAGYVRAGTVSLEVRHALRDPVDLTAALLVRCDGPAAFQARAEAVFAAQATWLPRAIAWMEGPGAAARELPRDQALLATAKGAGLDALFAGRGVSAAKLPRCVANEADRTLLAGMAQEAWAERAIKGTPHFMIDGQPTSAMHWAELEPLLKNALR